MQAFFFMVYDLLYLIWKLFKYNERQYKKKKNTPLEGCIYNLLVSLHKSSLALQFLYTG